MRPASRLKCEGVRAQISVALDGELSELERRMLRRHLELCADCADYERGVTSFTRLLREAPLDRPRHPVVVRLPRRASLAQLQLGGAAAAFALAVVGLLGIIAQFTAGGTPALPELNSAQPLTRYESRAELLREQLMLAGGNVYNGGPAVPL